MVPDLTLRRLGRTPYLDCLARMRAFVQARRIDRAAAGDEIWLTEHPPVFTLGFASRSGHLRDAGGIPVVATERGGQVTYHGPGQVVAYLLLDLRRRRLGVRELVSRLEDGTIACLSGYGIEAVRHTGAPGLYVAASGAKIASIGLKISAGFTWHGLALNGCMDLSPFDRIDPCGYPGLRMTDVATEAGTDLVGGVGALAQRLGDALSRAIVG